MKLPGILTSLFNSQPSSGDWGDYERMRASLPDKKTPLEDVTFYVIDIESTGLDPESDRILSLCAIPVQGNQIRIDKMLSLSVNQKTYKKESISIHEIMPEFNEENGISEKEAIYVFLRISGDGIWVGHFSGLDLKLIEAAAKRHGLMRVHNLVVDTSVLLSRAIDHYRNPDQLPQGSFQLSEVCKRLHIPVEGLHTAEGDALATAILFSKLVQILKKRGVKTLKDLL